MKRKSLLLLFVCLTLLAHAVKVNVKNAVDFVNHSLVLIPTQSFLQEILIQP